MYFGEIKKEKLALDLFGLGKIKFGAFKLKLHEKNPDAPLSPIYIDLRNLPDEIYQTIAELMAEILKNEKYGYIAGVPNAGDPIADALGEITKCPPLKLEKVERNGKRKVVPLEKEWNLRYIRDFKKSHPNASFENSVVIIDDLITHADSKLETIEALGLPVKKIVVVVNREQGGKEQLEKRGYKLEAIFSLTKDLLPLYVKYKKIAQERANEVIEYIIQNRIGPL